MVSTSSQITSGGTQDITYDRVEVNEGNGYSSATGRFTAPVGGTYLVYTSTGKFRFYMKSYQSLDRNAIETVLMLCVAVSRNLKAVI